MNARNKWTLLGFVLMLLGLLSLVVQMAGLQYSFLAWIEAFGSIGSFLFKIAMLIGGIAIVAVVNTRYENYDEYFDGDKYKK